MFKSQLNLKGIFISVESGIIFCLVKKNVFRGNLEY